MLVSAYGNNELEVVWDVCGVRCWVCGQETVAEGKAVTPLVIGGISVQSRTMSMNRCVCVCVCVCVAYMLCYCSWLLAAYLCRVGL